MKFEVGDVILEKGDGLLSGVVQLATDSPYSHVAVIYNYPTIIQSHALGVHLREIQSLGTVDVMRIKGGLNNKEKKQLQKVAIEKYIGKPYDYFQFTGAGKYFDQPNMQICSELFDEIYNELGYDVATGKELGKITPAESSKSELFEFVARDINAEKLGFENVLVG